MRISRIELLKLAVFLCLICSSSKVMAQENDHKKIVIAHRGASGYLPEHTMEAKTMAYAMGADYLEQDLVLSRDDVPVVIHDIYLEEVTNVKDVYPERSRSDGRYYVIDFTWEELSRLYVNERIDPKRGKVVYPNRFPSGKSNFRLHTLMDEIELIQGLNKSTGHQAGIYPEIKNPSFHRENGKDISSVVLGILHDYGYENKSDLCYLQCFDAEELKRIRKDLKSNLRLTQLIELPVEINRLEAYASYADAIGPSIMLFVKGIDGLGALQYNDLAERAHALGLKVHAYTFRKDDHPYFSSLEDLFRVCFRDLNIDGGFTDHPDLLVDFLNEVRH